MKILKHTILILLFSAATSQQIDCVGSSITRNGYPSYTDDLMKANGYSWSVNNYGVPGAGVVKNAYKDKPEYAEVIGRKSEIVILLLGAGDWESYSTASNDRRIVWEMEYRNLVNEFKKNSKVFLGLLIHRVETFPNGVEANATMDMMNLIINKVANDYGLPIIDFTSSIGTDPANFWEYDGLHPNNRGSELLGIAAYEALVNDFILSVDGEYWEAVEDYKEQKRIGWFGCQP